MSDPDVVLPFRRHCGAGVPGNPAGGLVAVFLLAPQRRASLVLAGVIAIVALADLFLQSISCLSRFSRTPCRWS